MESANEQVRVSGERAGVSPEPVEVPPEPGAVATEPLRRRTEWVESSPEPVEHPHLPGAAADRLAVAPHPHSRHLSLLPRERKGPGVRARLTPELNAARPWSRGQLFSHD